MLIFIPTGLKIVAYQILWSEKHKESDRLQGTSTGFLDPEMIEIMRLKIASAFYIELNFKG